jgi:hypothetical protein
VVRGTRVGDPLGADGRHQPHSAEGLRQGSLIPPPPPGHDELGGEGGVQVGA